MLVFLLGVIICLTGSFLTAVSNVVLKYLDNIQDGRLERGEEGLNDCNAYCALRYVTLIGGAIGDLVSMGMLPYGVWAGLNVSNLVWYMLLAQCFLDDPLEPLEALVLFIITSSVVGSAVFGPAPEEKGITALDDLVDMDWEQFSIIFPLTVILYVVFMYIQRTTYHEIQNNPNKYPPGYMPRPASVYNLSGPICFSIWTCFAQVAIKCTVGSLDPLTGYIAIPIVFIILLYPVHLWNLSFMANELHAVTCVPAHIMCTMLFNSLYGYVFFESKPTNSELYVFSLHLMLVALILYVLVEERIVQRDENEGGTLDAILLDDQQQQQRVQGMLFDDEEASYSIDKVRRNDYLI